MKVIGLTGGIGCGKSKVAEILKEEYNATILLTDDIAKAQYNKGCEGYIKLCELFGSAILDNQEEIDKSALATIIFNDSKQREKVNGIIHPIVRKIVEEGIDKSRRNNEKYVVVESAILVEAGYRDICDEIWFVKCDVNTRIERLMTTRGYTKEKCESIFANQAKEDEYLRNCDYVINNDSNITKLKEIIADIIGL